MTDEEVIEAYQTWSDEELLSHREACLSEAEVQVRFGQPRAAAGLRARAQIYTRAIPYPRDLRLIQTDLQTLRRHLVEAGIPQAIADDPNRGSYLAALLGQRLAGEEVSVKAACDAAGVAHGTQRQWRRRSPAFAAAEHRARYGAVDEDGDLEPYAIEADAPPEPEMIGHLRERLRMAYENCEDLGNGPYRGSPFQIEHKAGAYASNRQGVIDLIAELQSYGVVDRLPPVPPPLNPQPRQPARQHPPIDTSGWLWPTSINRHLPRRAR